MKIYSADSITKEAVEEMVRDAVINASQNARQMSDAVDKKQSQQIRRLEKLLLGFTALNMIVAVGAYFVKV